MRSALNSVSVSGDEVLATGELRAQSDLARVHNDTGTRPGASSPLPEVWEPRQIQMPLPQPGKQGRSLGKPRFGPWWQVRHGFFQEQHAALLAYPNQSPLFEAVRWRYGLG
jgi:hypothetical protein